MMVRRTHLVVLIGLFLLAAGLYWAKIEGQEARDRLSALEQTIVVDRRAVRTLEAEVAFLERPDRLEAAATDALGLTPVASKNRVTLSEMPLALADHATVKKPVPLVATKPSAPPSPKAALVTAAAPVVTTEAVATTLGDRKPAEAGQ